MGKTLKQRTQDKLNSLTERRESVAEKLKDLDRQIRETKSKLTDIEKKEVADLVLDQGLSVEELKSLLQTQSSDTAASETPTQNSSGFGSHDTSY
jgi:DNA-binding transcriptional MerR regulator